MKTTLLILIALSAFVSGETLPPDAEALKAKRDNKVAEIDRIYVAELEKLQKKHMKDGALDAATRIENEIKRVMPDPVADNPIVGKWKWGDSGTQIAEFTADGKAVARGFVGEWVEKKQATSEREYTVTWNNGSVTDYLTVLSNMEKGHVKNSYGKVFAAQKLVKDR